MNWQQKSKRLGHVDKKFNHSLILNNLTIKSMAELDLEGNCREILGKRKRHTCGLCDV